MAKKVERDPQKEHEKFIKDLKKLIKKYRIAPIAVNQVGQNNIVGPAIVYKEITQEEADNIQ